MSDDQGVPVAAPTPYVGAVIRWVIAWGAGYSIGWLVADELDSRRRARARAHRLLADLVDLDQALRDDYADALDQAAAAECCDDSRRGRADGGVGD